MIGVYVDDVPLPFISSLVGFFTISIGGIDRSLLRQ